MHAFMFKKSGVFVDCQICENKDYDLCLFAVDQGVIYRDLTAEGGQMLVIIDTIIPFLDNEIKLLPYGKKAIMMYNKIKYDEQEL